MSSLRRILSSRANAARSRGPRTPAGKTRSSLNALRHGLLAQCVVLENESRAGFDALLAEYLGRFGPVDGVELGMIEEMVAAFWRQRRAWAIETRIIDSAVAGQSASPERGELASIAAAFTDLAGQPPLGLLHRYETRLHRVFQRALHNLLLLRSWSAAAVPNEPSPIPGHPEPAHPLIPPPTSPPGILL